MLRGDPDLIVSKAMHRDLTQRYASAADLAHDVRAWMEHRPIRARKESFSYTATRFIRRHRVGVSLVGAIAGLILVSLIVVARQQRKVNEANAQVKVEAGRAQRSLVEMRQLASGLLGDVYDTIEDIPGAAEARRLLLQRASTALETLATEAKSDASFREAVAEDLANAYLRRGDFCCGVIR